VLAGGTAINWGPGAPRRRMSLANRSKPLQWNNAHADFFAKHGRRRRVFCASLADIFDIRRTKQSCQFGILIG